MRQPACGGKLRARPLPRADRATPATPPPIRASTKPLELWHGFTAALGLSVLAVVTGLALFAAQRRGRALGQLGARLPQAEDAYAAALRGLGRLADRVTGIAQNGSLPVYLGVILLTAIGLPAPALLASGVTHDAATLASSPLQLGIAAVVATAALLVVRARHRLEAALFLGAVGYGVALLFVIQGAPDLALTQLVVETLTLVLFVLALRHPARALRGAPLAAARRCSAWSRSG